MFHHIVALLVLISSASPAVLPVPPPILPKDQRPNILLFFPDELRYDWVYLVGVVC